MVLKTLLFAYLLMALQSCGKTTDYSGLIFYDSKSAKSTLPGAKVDYQLYIGRDEHGEIYFIALTDKFNAEYQDDINLELVRDSSVRMGFKSLKITSLKDVMIIYPNQSRDVDKIDIFKVKEDKIIVERMSRVSAANIIMKYK